MAVLTTFESSFLRVEYDRTPACAEGHAVTRRGAIGVAFTGQDEAVWAWNDGSSIERPYGAATVFIAGQQELVWRRWSRVSEAIEIWPAAALFTQLGERAGAVALPDCAGLRDPVIGGIAAQFRRALLSGDSQRLQLDTCALILAEHLLRRYSGTPSLLRQPIRRFSQPQLDRVHEYVSAHLSENLSLVELARLLAVSPFHFAKRFKATFGVSPHAYLVARRMERSMELLLSTQLSVAKISERAGYSNLSHFRRQFAAHWGRLPAQVR
jgi:AraC family transcriptional regulator